MYEMLPEVKGKTALKDLTPQEFMLLTAKLKEAVLQSYFVDQTRSKFILRTGWEDRKRLTICLQFFCDMVIDQKWGVRKAMDQMTVALRKKLDQVDFSPSKRRAYRPGSQVVLSGEE